MKQIQFPKGIVARFLRDVRGGAAVVLAVALPTTLAAAGMAVDYLGVTTAKSNLRNLVDAAVLAGVSASDKGDVQIARANSSFAKNLGQYRYEGFAATFKVDGQNLVGNGTATYDTAFLRLFGYPKVGIKTASAATASGGTKAPMCVMAMDPTRMHTLFITTNSTLTVYGPSCNFYGNSNNADDVIDPKDPGSFVVAKSVATIGGGHHYLGNVTPPAVFGTTVIADPLAKMQLPSSGGCTQTNYRVTNMTTTLPPGTYCKGLTIQQGSNVTLQPGGTYIVSGGAFKVLSSSLTGVGVTIALADSSSSVDWEGSKIQLSAPTFGDYAGMAVMAPATAGDDTFDTTTAGSTIDIEGVFYMPGSYVTWKNAGTPIVSSKWTAYIADGFNWDGSGQITINFDLASSNVPYPQSLYAIPQDGTRNPRLLY